MEKTALITGSTSGIGYGFAKLLAKEQINLVLVARSNDKLADIKKELEEKHNINILIISEDLSDPISAEEIYTELKNKKIEIDILINNAGVGEYGLFVETDWKKEYQMIQLNIITLTHLTKIFSKRMIERKMGNILNVASTAGFQPGPLMAVYFATKSYVLSFTEAIANELKDTGVSVTALCPGPTSSGFHSASSIKEIKLIKGRKLPTSDDVAEFGYNAMKKGKTVAIYGFSNKLITIAVRFLPRNIVTNIVRKLQEYKRK